MGKLSRKQIKAITLLNDMLSSDSQLNDDEKLIVSDFIANCINNVQLNRAAFHLMVENKNAPLAAIFIIIKVSFQTRKFPKLKQALDEKKNDEIESFVEYVMLRDIASLQRVLLDLEPHTVINHNSALYELKEKVEKCHQMIKIFEQKMSADTASDQLGLFKQYHQSTRTLLHFFSNMAKHFASKKKSMLKKNGF